MCLSVAGSCFYREKNRNAWTGDEGLKTNLVIKDIDDYYRFMNSELGLFEQIGSTQCYQIHPHFGKGFVERISLRHGVDICILSMELMHDLELICQMEETCFEILYCAGGQASYGDYEKGTKTTIKGSECDCWLNDGGQNWLHFSGRVPWQSISVCYDQRFIESFLEMASTQCDMDRMKAVLDSYHKGNDRRYGSSPDIELAFYQIMNCSQEGIARLLYLESKAVEIFSLFIQNELLLQEPNHYKIFLSQEDRSKLDQARRIIVDNMLEPLSVEQLAREIDLNTFKLKVGFKEMWGTTIFGYLRDMRMEKARFLLSGARKNVIAVAQEVGYSNPSHFSAAFKRKYGINPHEYANKMIGVHSS